MFKKWFMYATLAASVLIFPAFKAGATDRDQQSSVKARTIAEDEKRGIKFSEDKKTLVKYNCDLTDKEYVIPDGVTAISFVAFKECSSLTSVTIPSSVTTIEWRAFAWCTKLASVTIKDGVKIIDNEAFRACSNLTNVTIPSSVTTIGENAFDECTNLKNVDIQSEKVTIGKNAFLNCPCEKLVKKLFPKYAKIQKTQHKTPESAEKTQASGNNENNPSRSAAEIQAAIVAPTRARAEAGDVDAQIEMGVRYEYGISVPQDYQQAVYWYRRAAAQGNSKAQLYLDSLLKLLGYY